MVHLQRLIFALTLETNLRASVELCRLRTWPVEPRDYGRPSSAIDEISPKSAVSEEAGQAQATQVLLSLTSVGHCERGGMRRRCA